MPPRTLDSRRTTRIDFANADWQRNEFGVDMLVMSQCTATGAVTFALRTPRDFHYAERQHYYDCEEELFQFEGDFRHDRVRPYSAGDYVYRPVGTVYGDDEGSDEGGLIIASLARERMRHHFDDHPKPWLGHYLVDWRWNTRREQPFVLQSRTVGWEPSGLGEGVEMRVLHGAAGVRRDERRLFEHSPWASDFTLMLRVPAGFRGPMPSWAGFHAETLACAGRATIGGEPWHRGCYQFAGPGGTCIVEETLEVYCRYFSGGGGA